MKDPLLHAMLGTIVARVLVHYGARMARLSPASSEKIASLVVDAAFYSGVWLWLCYSFSGQHWMHWTAWRTNARIPHPPCPAITATFQAMASYYTTKTVLVWASSVQKHKMATALHHIATVLLLACSYASAHTRPGIVLLFIYAAFEPPFLLSCVLHELGVKQGGRVLFLASCAVFVLTRLVLAPALAAVTVYAYVGREASAYERCGLALLVAIMALQLYWAVLLRRMYSRFGNKSKPC